MTSPKATAAQFQEHSRFAYWQLKRARGVLDQNSISISRIPRESAPVKTAQAAAPHSTPLPPTHPKEEIPPLPYSPLNPQRTLPTAPDDAGKMAAFASEIALASLQNLIHPKDSVSK